jgi:hypothetical protein
MASWINSGPHPDPKPEKRHKASQREWDTIHTRFRDECCVACGLRTSHLHHIIYRSEGGDDLPVNLCPLCDICHDKLHGHRGGWERVAGHIRAYVLGRTSRTDYVLKKVGQDRFDRRYPEPVFLAMGDLDSYRRPDVWLREGEGSLSEPDAKGGRPDVSGSESVEGYERNE